MAVLPQFNRWESKLRRECGKVFTHALIAATVAASGGFAFVESAGAGALPNSVRVGDRSKMHIVGLPSPGEKRIVLKAPQRPAARADARPAAPSGTSSHDWFWSAHSPAASEGGRTRFPTVLGSLRDRREMGAGGVSSRLIAGIIARHGDAIARAAERHGVSAALIAAVIAIESAGRDTAVSHKGAQGLMQLIPATAKRFGVANSFDAEANIDGGAAYLDWLLERFSEDAVLALAGYNAGEGAVDKHRGVPPYRETRDYVVKVLDALAAAERLCPARVEGPRHPCPLGIASR